MSLLGQWVDADDGGFVICIAEPIPEEPWVVETSLGELVVRAATWSTGGDAAPIRLCKLLDSHGMSSTMDEIDFSALKVLRAEDAEFTEYEVSYGPGDEHELVVTPDGKEPFRIHLVRPEMSPDLAP